MKLLAFFIAIFSAYVALAAPVGPTKHEHAFAAPRASSVNQVLAVITRIFPFNVPVRDLQKGLTNLLQVGATVIGLPTTHNAQLETCPDIAILYARGTVEPGNVGIVAGHVFFQAVADKAKGKTVVMQGTNNYLATITSFLEGGDKAGSQQLASDIQNTVTKCPSTKVVVAGYSQGGQLVHNAAQTLGKETMANKISSIVIFGDPNNGTPIAGAEGKTKIICHDTDNICEHGDLILPSHLTYSEDADDAASFVVQQAGF